MSKDENLMRIYGMPDAVMLQRARLLKAVFIEDKVEFIDEDPDFDDPFSDDWQAKIDEAASFISDLSIKAQQTGKTNVVINKMKECVEKSGQLERFVNKAFPGNKAVFSEFGFNNHKLLKISQEQMIAYMNNLYNTSKKYQAELLAKKYTTERIEEISALSNQLLNSDIEQESSKDTRPELTHERIGKLNATYTIMQDVSKVGKKINKDNPSRRKRYVLTDGGGEATPPPVNPDNPK